MPTPAAEAAMLLGPDVSVKSAGARISADNIPTLEIKIRAANNSRHDATVERLLEIEARPGAASQSRRSSQRIITTVVFSLLAIVSVTSALDAIDAAKTTDAAGQSSTQTPLADIPSLVLLQESWRPHAPLLAREQLVNSITQLLETQRDEVTINFALQSLKTVVLADANNSLARQRLEDLARQLADEATAQFDQGNTPLAQRLIQQAAESGSANEYVGRAAEYIAGRVATGNLSSQF